MGCPTSKKGAKETGASSSSGVLVSSSLLCVQTLDLFFSVSLVLISRVDPATVCLLSPPPCPLFHRRDKCVRECDVDISMGSGTRTCLKERRARQGDKKTFGRHLINTTLTGHHLIEGQEHFPNYWCNPQSLRGFFRERVKEREREKAMSRSCRMFITSPYVIRFLFMSPRFSRPFLTRERSKY